MECKLRVQQKKKNSTLSQHPSHLVPNWQPPHLSFLKLILFAFLIPIDRRRPILSCPHNNNPCRPHLFPFTHSLKTPLLVAGNNVGIWLSERASFPPPTPLCIIACKSVNKKYGKHFAGTGSRHRSTSLIRPFTRTSPQSFVVYNIHGRFRK